MGRELLLDTGLFDDLRRDRARRRHRRETVPCKLCGELPTPEGHDPCITNLPGVTSECCGHGRRKGYALFETGQTITGYFDCAPRKR
jgi:hypothetical protein